MATSLIAGQIALVRILDFCRDKNIAMSGHSIVNSFLVSAEVLRLSMKLMKGEYFCFVDCGVWILHCEGMAPR